MTPEQLKALRMAEDMLTAVLCDPEGKCCISGSMADLRIVDSALAILRHLATQPQAQPEPVARLLHWKAPAHIPVPHGGIAARTFAEFPEDTPVDHRYWHEGEPLYTHPPQGADMTPEQIAEALHKESFTILSRLQSGTEEVVRLDAALYLLRTLAEQEPVACNLSVGCDEAGVCYAEAHGQPEQCPKHPPKEPT